MDYFAYTYNDVMTSKKMDELFDGRRARPRPTSRQREMDIAASIQAVTEEIVMRIARHATSSRGCKNLCMAGGVALNCVANGKLLREGPFDDVWIQPAAGDAGGALGAATFVWHQLLDEPRDNGGQDVQSGSLLGPDVLARGDPEYLDSVGAVYHYHEDDEKLFDNVAELLATENVVGHVGGRMEFGPRALGARSILGDARSPKMQTVMNLKIKFRESFRPFAPIVLREKVDEYFEMRPNEDSPVHAAGGAGARGQAHPGAGRERQGHRQAQAAALGGAGHHPRRLLGAGADRRRRAAPALLPDPQGLRGEDGLPGADQHQL